jgi:hypothetical protein
MQRYSATHKSHQRRRPFKGRVEDEGDDPERLGARSVCAVFCGLEIFDGFAGVIKQPSISTSSEQQRANVVSQDMNM